MRVIFDQNGSDRADHHRALCVVEAISLSVVAEPGYPYFEIIGSEIDKTYKVAVEDIDSRLNEKDAYEFLYVNRDKNTIDLTSKGFTNVLQQKAVMEAERSFIS